MGTDGEILGDVYGDNCATQTRILNMGMNPYCDEYYDTEDFDVNEMCCACGGGKTGNTKL